MLVVCIAESGKHGIGTAEVTSQARVHINLTACIEAALVIFALSFKFLAVSIFVLLRVDGIAMPLVWPLLGIVMRLCRSCGLNSASPPSARQTAENQTVTPELIVD